MFREKTKECRWVLGLYRDPNEMSGASALTLTPRSYISDANAQRKYEDGKALSEALGEIRAEIAKLTLRT